MSRQFWRFAVTALFGTILVAVLLAVSNNRMVKQQLMELGAEQNIILSHSLSNSIRAHLDALLRSEPSLNDDNLNARLEIEQFQSVLTKQVSNLSIVKVKVYDKLGLVVFSTRPEQIGEDLGTNPGVISALNGAPVSNLIYKNRLNTFDNVIEDHNAIHSYLPIRNEMNIITGVFEIYTEVTPLLNRIRKSQRWIIVAVSGVLGLFYAVLVAAYARTDRAQQREQQAKQNQLHEIEQQVVRRTRELEESRSFLQTIMDGMSDAVMVIDTDFRVISMNRAARGMLPRDTDPAGPVYCYRAMHHRTSPCVGIDCRCTLQKVLRTGQSCTHIHTHYLPNKEPRRIEVMASALRNSEGEITGIVEVNHDITEREQLQSDLIQARDAAERASHAKSEFVASMSHEIRTPMNAVIGMTDLLLKTRLTRKQQEYIQIIQSSGDMLLSVVDSILDFSRLEAGALALEKHAIDVTELLDSVLEMMGYQAYSKGLELVGLMATPDLQYRVSGDSDRLRQILVNLASNAIKFTEQGQVVLKVESVSEDDSETLLRFEVQDSGIGIDEAVQDKLFEPYTRIDVPAVRHNGGAGLGLTICKQLVECMGGQIGVESEPGQGSTFWFTVTLDKVAKPDIASSRSRLAGKRILVVDDHPITLEMLCHNFNSWGMACECVSNARDALQSLQKVSGTVDAFDIAVIDVDMPGTGGVSLARRIRADAEAAGLPLVLVCSVAKPLNIGMVTSLTQAQCVHKPVLASQLYNKLLEVTHIEKPVQEDVANNRTESLVNHPRSARILVAEDNAFSHQLLLDMLGSLGYQADSAVDGLEVLEAMENTAYDLILMDSQMPGMNGGEATERIREGGSQYAKQPLIVALSADVSMQHREACLEAGMDEFISKPVRLEKLTAGLQRWLPEPAAAALETDSSDEPSSLHASVRGGLGEVNGAMDNTFQERYLSLFLEDAYARVKAMNTALDTGELEQLRREAHALKGSCMQLGIKPLYDNCEALHEAAGNGETDVAVEKLQRLQVELGRVRDVQTTE